MDTSAIREAIARACLQEQKAPSLHRFFSERLDELEQRLVLPPVEPIEALVDFAGQYIDAVPDFLEQIAAQDRPAETLGYLNMAADFFIAPPGLVEDDHGLKALLDEAFLAQRLLEELNDLALRRHSRPLLCRDMTRANIIVHHLLGDQLASRLECLVAQCLELLAREERFAAFSEDEGIGRGHWDEAPCMSRGANIDLRLRNQLSS